VSSVTILDLGYGNTRSVALALERLGARCILSADPEMVGSADRLVLPGVGAARSAMRALEKGGLGPVIRARTRPTLGICLGMQLMFEESEEDGGVGLLALIPGTVQAISPAPRAPVPHMGWSRLEEVNGPIGLGNGDYVYFAHGFACPDNDTIVARARYGDAVVPAVLRRDHLWGAQFHPERSSTAGSSFLKAFLRS
jgi:glutamine amidotransferase